MNSTSAAQTQSTVNPEPQSTDPASRLFDQRLSDEERIALIADLTPPAKEALTAFLDVMASERRRKTAEPAPKPVPPTPAKQTAAPYPVNRSASEETRRAWFMFGWLVANEVLPAPDIEKCMDGKVQGLELTIAALYDGLDMIRSNSL